MADILLIDDDAELCRVIAIALSEAGHRVREAKDGTEGVAAFYRRRPTMVITDIIMPDMEGIQTIQEMRKHAPDLPIIAISGASAAEHYLHLAASLGASTTLQKPFRLDRLLGIVDDLLENAVTSSKE